MAGGGDIKAGRAYVELLLKDGAFTKGLKNASSKLKSFGSGAASLGTKFLGLGTAFVAPFVAAISHFADFGSALDDISQRTGMAAGAVAELGFAAEMSGSSLSTVEGGVRKMQKMLASGSQAATESLQGLGLTLAELRGLAPDQQFEEIAARIASIEDPAKRTAAAMEIFGKSGAELVPMMADLQALRQQARDLELIPSEKAVADAAAVGDAIDTMKRTFGSVIFEIGASVAETVLQSIDFITGIAVAITRWVRENQALFSTILKIGAAIAAAGAIIIGFGLAIAAAGFALSGIATGLSVLGTILGAILSPIGLITAAIVGGIWAWTQYTESGKAALSGFLDVLGDLFTTVKDTFGGIFDAIASGNLALAGTIALTGLRLAFMQGLAAIAKLFGGAFGDLLGTLGTQIAGGDFAGAWNTAIAGMAAVWDSFAEGIVAVFTNAARAVTDIWQKTTTAIADFILEDAANGGVLGRAALAGSGVDVEKESKRGGRLDKERRDWLKNRRSTLEGQLSAADANGGSITDFDGQTVTADDLKRQIADTNEALGINVKSFLDSAKSDAAADLGSTADAIRDKLSEIDKSAQERTRQSEADLHKQTEGGTEAASDEVTSLQSELAKLVQEAADLRAAEAEKRRLKTGEIGTGDELAEAGPSKVFGSFSAAAAMAQGGGGSPVVKKLDSLDKKLEKLVEIDEKQTRISEKTKDAILTGGMLQA